MHNLPRPNCDASYQELSVLPQLGELSVFHPLLLYDQKNNTQFCSGFVQIQQNGGHIVMLQFQVQNTVSLIDLKFAENRAKSA